MHKNIYILWLLCSAHLLGSWIILLTMEQNPWEAASYPAIQEILHHVLK